ncbi:eCIS core domain-containing protein [Streptomyces sp. NPDC054864]
MKRPVQDRIPPGASLHRAQSFYQNESLSAARFYTGPTAQRAVEAFAAEAITVGTHVLLGRRAEHDERIIGHELGHVDKNTRGEIETGTDHGAGVAVTDPRQSSERTAETDGAAYAAGASTAPSVAQRATAGHPPATDSSSLCSDDSVQRYTTVHPIDSEYPKMGRQSPGGTRSTVRRGDFFDTSGDDFFPGQDMQPRTVRTQAL